MTKQRLNPLSVIHKIVAGSVLSSVLFLGGCGGSDGTKLDAELPQTKPATGQVADGNLKEIINYIRIDAGLPAMAAIVIVDGAVIEKASDGLRSIDSTIQVTDEDKWHIGSITKSMSATLAAKLVEQGVISWDTTISDIYPNLVGTMRQEYEDVQLDELLSHASGMRANLPNLNDYVSKPESIVEQRQQMVKEALVLKPDTSRGNMQYSNLGYMVAGAMLETVTNTSWEELMQIHVFAPLAMTDAGFGAPDVSGDLTEPVGHNKQGSGWKAQIPSPTNLADNVKVLGPAGTAHATLNDMAAYMNAHLKGARGESVNGLINSASFNKLHTSSTNANYALGWIVDGKQLHHNGSNTMWLANVIVNSDDNYAIFVATNAADLNSSTSKALRAVDELNSEIVQRIKNAN